MVSWFLIVVNEGILYPSTIEDNTTVRQSLLGDKLDSCYDAFHPRKSLQLGWAGLGWLKSVQIKKRNISITHRSTTYPQTYPQGKDMTDHKAVWDKLEGAEQWAVYLIVQLRVMNLPEIKLLMPVSDAIAYIRCAYGCNTYNGGPDAAAMQALEDAGVLHEVKFDAFIKAHQDDEDGEEKISQWMDENISPVPMLWA
jgi:hypothetical protein